jgi:hypothetical protein
VHFYHHKSIGKIITDGLINKSQIINHLQKFFLIKFVLIDWEYKYQYKIPSLNLKILVVRSIFISLLNSLLDSMFPNLIKWWLLSNVGLDSCFPSVCFRCQNVEYIIVYNVQQWVSVRPNFVLLVMMIWGTCDHNNH